MTMGSQGGLSDQEADFQVSLVVVPEGLHVPSEGEILRETNRVFDHVGSRVEWPSRRSVLIRVSARDEEP